MKIYTSYFANLKNLEKEDIFPIGICCYPPKWFNGPNLGAIAPTPDILEKCKSSHAEYEKRYKAEVLSIFKDVSTLINKISYISGGKDVALCCYEKPSDFCHRHILRNLMNRIFHIPCEELEVVDSSKKQTKTQTALF